MKKFDVTILPLAISALLVLISVVITLTTDKIFRQEHFIGIPALGIAILLYFTARKYYFLIFALILTIGMLGFLDLYITTYKFGFGSVGINPIFLGLLILFFTSGKKHMDELSPKKVNHVKNDGNTGLIKSFELRFADKPTVELQEIIDSKSGYTKEAKVAAERVLKGRKQTRKKN